MRWPRRFTLDPGPQSTLIYDSKDRLFSALNEEHRMPVRLEEMSQHLVAAVLVTEDRRFQTITTASTSVASSGGRGRQSAPPPVTSSKAAAPSRQNCLRVDSAVPRLSLDLFTKNQRSDPSRGASKSALREARDPRVVPESCGTLASGYYGVQAAAIGYFGKQVSELDVVEACNAGRVDQKEPSVYSLM